MRAILLGDEELKKDMTDKWYIEAVEVLSPLRYHMFQLLSDIETHKGFCEALGQPFKLRSLEAALVAIDEVELFFTGSKAQAFHSLRSETKS